jgi:hypothetical protein
MLAAFAEFETNLRRKRDWRALRRTTMKAATRPQGFDKHGTDPRIEGAGHGRYRNRQNKLACNPRQPSLQRLSRWKAQVASQNLIHFTTIKHG